MLRPLLAKRKVQCSAIYIDNPQSAWQGPLQIIYAK
jgi:hypothetical protein